MSQVIFCTSHIDSDPNRYQGWVVYYTKFFSEDIDLLMINDGPVHTSIDLGRVKLLEFPEHLGRPSMTCMPGWKRSFGHILAYCRERYVRIGHIESDCLVREKGREEYLNWLNTYGYYTGACKTHNFAEPALQILNEPERLAFYIDRYSNPDMWEEEWHFELQVMPPLRPHYIMDGDRIEGIYERIRPQYNYLANFDIFFQHLGHSYRKAKENGVLLS